MIKTYNQQLNDIKENGIKRTDAKAEYKLKLLAHHYLMHTSYRNRKKEIRNIILDKAEDCFSNLSEDEKNNKLDMIMHDASHNVKYDTAFSKMKIDLYESEMQKIMEIEDRQLRRMAFASLVVFKYYSTAIDKKTRKLIHYKETFIHPTDIAMVAQVRPLSGKKRDFMIFQLQQMGMIKTLLTNGRSKFIIPYAEDNNPDAKIWKTMDDDLDNALLYLRLYEGDKRVRECQRCGAPIEIKPHVYPKKYCSKCGKR